MKVFCLCANTRRGKDTEGAAGTLSQWTKSQDEAVPLRFVGNDREIVIHPLGSTKLTTDLK